MADLPRGTVTFLFTDIEGSTDLLKKLRGGYGEVLADQRRLLRGVFEEHGGREIDMQGDAFFVVFESARSAVAGAVAGQRALADHRWPEGIEVRVRMGLHTGEPSLRDEGYLGLAVHRAARICSAGYGGQVLLSRSTSAVLEDDELEGISLRDLGDHRLKDIERAERIYQLLIDGLLNDLRTPKTYEAQPLKATPFAGQENELARAAQTALATRRKRIAEWRNQRLARLGVRSREFLRLIAQAAWGSTTARIQLLAMCVVVGLTLALEPWWVVVAAFFIYGVLLALNLRGHSFFHGIGLMGWRVHSLASITPEGALREAIRDLAGTMVRVGRTVAEVDKFLAGVSRRSLAHRLEELRQQSTAWPATLRSADILAREIAALDRLIEQRQILDEERRRLEPNLAKIRDRIFEVRLGRSPADDLRSEITASCEMLSEIAGQLSDAFADVKSYARALNGKTTKLRT
jgi:class 3 adenylate cyclase